MAGNSYDLKLNKEQIEAIKHGSGPLLIIAGAGTGKTTVITERVKRLFLSKKVKPSEVLALTFTEKAAREMEERIDVALPYGYTQMWISTFHSFCDRVLRDSALNIGLDPRYKLMTEAEAIQLIRNNLFKLDLDYFRPLGNPTKFVGGMLSHFSRLQDEDTRPSDYMDWVKEQKSSYAKASEDKKLEVKKWDELSRAYRTYDELKTNNGFLDFGDLIIKALQLFRSRPNVLKEYQNQFRYVLVDEFQDTNIAQNELVKLLVGKAGNVTVVLDDDQAIYRWRGAAVSNALSFRKSFPKARVVTLTRNYRSTQEILDRAYDLIQHNNPDRLEVIEKVDKKLVSQRNDLGEPIKFIHSDRVENEADRVAKEIKELIANPPSRKASEGLALDYKDIAILVRANNHAEPFGRALGRLGIPYQFLGPGRLFRQPEIVDLISYLKVLYNFEDSVALYRLLSINYFDIHPRDLASIGNYARRYNLSVFETLESIDDVFVRDETKEKVKKTLEIISKHLKLIRRETAGQLLYYFLESTGLLTKMLSADSSETEKKAANISKFFDKLKTYEIDHKDATVPAVVDWLELSSELGESPLAADIDWSDINAVNILTVHSSKGLEFPIVFLVNLVDQRFPTVERREQIPIPEELIKEILPVGDYHLEEERRLFYVGMTRAKDLLFFTGADYYGEAKREKRLSPFIFEALGENVASSEQQVAGGEQLSFLDYKPSEAILPATSYKLPIHIDFLSYSQIETFRTCPLHYKLRYIFKVPTPPSAPLSFGSSIHDTLKDFYLEVKGGKKPSEKFLFETLAKNWMREGFTSKTHEQKFFERAKEYLSSYLKTEFSPKKLPVALEQPFIIPLSSPSVRSGRPLKVGGKIDRVDDTGKGQIEIIDYKTGANVPTQRDVDHDLQLTFYALAATSIPEIPFGKKPEDVVLTLYYFDNQRKISTIRTKKQLDEATNEIFSIREEIEKSDFKCSNHIFCQNNCEYSLFCRDSG